MLKTHKKGHFLKSTKKRQNILQRNLRQNAHQQKNVKKKYFFPQDHEDSPVQDLLPCHKMHHQATKRPEKGLTDRANHQIACRKKKSALRGQRRCHTQHETPFSHQF